MTATTFTGLLLIIVPILFNVAFFMLQRSFSYPDILRQPTDAILRRFQAGGRPLRRLWYGFAFTSLIFIPVPVLLHQLFGPAAPWYLAPATVLGVLAGLVQVLGLLRWSFLVPSLAELYTRPDSSPATRDSAAVVFQAFHQYAGVALGEHLGYMFTGLWSLLVSLAIIQTAFVPPLLGWLGLIPALGILVGLLEEAGFKSAGLINALSYILWSLWLIAFGIALLLRVGAF
ncbi:MAG: DUF4386 domain-containing protein [Anaerolineales bacterium]